MILISLKYIFTTLEQNEYFYCAMHYSAKRGLAIAHRLSVTLVDHTT